MQIFITGIAGFIGFHLAQYLYKRGDLVCGCDNFNSYYDPTLKRERAKRLQALGIEIREIDICHPLEIEKMLKEKEISHLVHLAAQAGVRHSIAAPQSYVDSNLHGFVQVMEICKRRPEMKCIFASSSSVYGLNKKIPFSEEDPTDQPASLYGATKKSNELIAHAYHQLYGISAVGLRYFTAYGPWGRPDMAYFSFTRAIVEGTPLPVFASGQMRRDFTYIDDIIQGTAAAIDYETPFAIFNLGNNHPEDTLTLISLIEKSVGKKANKQFLPAQPGEVQITYADISKSRSLLGFHPRISLETGIAHFVNWYQEYYR